MTKIDLFNETGTEQLKNPTTGIFSRIKLHSVNKKLHVVGKNLKCQCMTDTA